MMINANLSNQNLLESTNIPEIDLLLSCAKNNLNSKPHNKTNLIPEAAINWQYLLEISRRHKILPLIYASLSNQKFKNCDNSLYQNFSQAFQANIARNLQLTSELLKILKFLQTHNIEAIPVKGSVLARQAYSNFGLRSISDLDIVVRKSDFATTQQLLMQYGYQANPTNQEDYYQQAQYYKKNGVVVSIDLHYEFAPKNHFVAVDSSLFWQNLDVIAIGNYKIKVFSIEYSIIHICLEGLKENWRFLSRLCDLSGLICNQEIDWKLLLAHAEALKKRKVVFLGLYLARTIFQIRLPDDVWLEIDRCLEIKLSREQIYNFLFRHQFNLFVTTKWYLFNGQVFDSLPDKLKYLYQVSKIKIYSKKH